MTVDLTATTAKLLPCPFCGSMDVCEPLVRDPWMIYCGDCGATVESHGEDDVAVRKKWNTRPQPAPPAQWTFTITKKGTIGCRHSWAGTNNLSVCLKCRAEGLWQPPHLAPPAGNPDYAAIALELFPVLGMGMGQARHKVRVELERMYRLGLAARPKVEDGSLRLELDAAHHNHKKDNEYLLQRAETLAAKLAEREAELAMAFPIIAAAAQGGSVMIAAGEWMRSYDAARQQQKASPEPTSSRAGETR